MMFLIRSFIFVVILMMAASASEAAPVPLTVNLDEAVVVTGTPRLQLDVGGVTRYAPYLSGSGTNALSFSYPVVAPDFDRNGITLVSPLDLNGGTIRDLNGNNANLNFTVPNTAGVLVQSYTVVWTTSPITATNETAAAFNIVGAPTSGATYNYAITSDGGAGTVTGSGSITADPHSVTGINVSTLPAGTLTLSVTVTNATGTGNAKTNTVSGVFTGAVDGLSAGAAYSTRRLSSTYTGSLIRVRRSSDNAEQDIGYTLAGNLNTTALTTFCGVNSCFVRTWYDQSGNGRDAIQTTNGSQPRIVNAGAIDTVNGRNAVRFLGAQSMTGAAVTQNLLGNTPTFSVVVSPSSIVNYTPIFIWRASGSVNAMNMNNAGGWTYHWNDTITTYNWTGGPAITTGSLQAINVSIQPGFATYNKDGSSFTNTTPHATTSGTAPILIGNDTCCGGRFLNGFVPEIILFPTLSTVNNTALENNQKAYYGIP